ncbi:ORF94 [White spot syndrome virus]|uniref:ORF94 n=1 Tax=White spot syndrome virus TaxID=342409 RepID=A0A2D3I6E7_9VIRU|nr:ORF94 [White spot syndrome virus]
MIILVEEKHQQYLLEQSSHQICISNWLNIFLRSPLENGVPVEIKLKAGKKKMRKKKKKKRNIPYQDSCFNL